ncbi:MAG: hypothetical protein V2I97_21645 [Desulfococcaceae bacterium]|nr:hypothetical protein [Desulfococcaceae bacterium]
MAECDRKTKGQEMMFVKKIPHLTVLAVSFCGYFILSVNIATIYYTSEKTEYMRNNIPADYGAYEGILDMRYQFNESIAGSGFLIFGILIIMIIIMITVPSYIFCLLPPSEKNCLLFVPNLSSILLAHAHFSILFIINYARKGNHQKMLVSAYVFFAILFISGGLYYLIRKRKKCLASEHRIYYMTGLLYGIPGILIEIILLLDYANFVNMYLKMGGDLNRLF